MDSYESLKIHALSWAYSTSLVNGSRSHLLTLGSSYSDHEHQHGIDTRA